MKRTSLVLGISLSLAIAPITSAARAAPKKSEAAGDAAERAARLKKLGDEALLGARYAEALQYYDESLRIAANPALHYNRGRALEALERIPEAIAAYDTFSTEAPTELRAKTPALAGHVEELRRRTTRLEVDVDVPGARVLLRGAVVGRTPLAPLRVMAGTASIEVEADGYVTHRESVDLHGGDDATIKVHLVPRPSALAPTPAPSAVERTAEDGDRSVLHQWWFWTGVGVVVAGGATALVIALSHDGEPASRSGTLGTVTGPLLRF